VSTLLTSPKYSITWKTFLLPVIGLVAFLVYIYLFNVNIPQIITTVGQINFNLYLLAAITVLLDTAFFTLAWHSLIRFLSVRIPWFKEFTYVWVGIFIDTLIPAESVSGEITKIYMVNKEQSGSAGKATASIVAQRLIGMGMNIVTLLVGAILLFAENLLYGVVFTLILFIIAITLLFLALTLLLCVKENWTMRIVDAMISFAERITRGHWKLDSFREEVTESTKAFHVAMKEYGHAPKTLFIASSFSITSWILSLVVFYLTFLSIGYSQISWSAILIICTIFASAKSIPVGVPFEVGLPEITLSSLLILFGIPYDVSFTATILWRLLTLWLRFFIGFVAQQWIGIKSIVATPDAARAAPSTGKA
jgi:uncharacterized protein (TIRG00374 family)